MFFKRTFIASTLMILTMVCVHYWSHSRNIPPVKPFSTFPKQIGEWVGIEGRFDEKVYQILGVDDSFLCNYTMVSGKQVQLYIGYYENQSEGDLIHSPKNCMPGAGWNIVQASSEDLNIPVADYRKVKVAKLIIERDDQRQVVFYWFQSRGRIIASEYMQKIYLVMDSIMRHRTDDTFVRLIMPVIDGNEKSASKDLKHFSELLIPLLQEYIP